MNQALYAHMNNKRKMKKKKEANLVSYIAKLSQKMFFSKRINKRMFRANKQPSTW
jgi:hypothetical protein